MPVGLSMNPTPAAVAVANYHGRPIAPRILGRLAQGGNDRGCLAPRRCGVVVGRYRYPCAHKHG